MDEMEPLRNDAIRALSEAVAADRLPVEQVEARLALVRQAPTRASLEAIMADVLPTGAFAAPGTLVHLPADPTWAGPVAPAEVLRIATVLGSTRRAGSWTVPLRLELRCVLGEITLDMRDAIFGADVVDIALHVVMGSVTLIVPAGTQVENECTEHLSSSTHSTRSARGAAPIGLLLRITGGVVLGSIHVRERRPTADEPDRRPEWLRGLLGGGD